MKKNKIKEDMNLNFDSKVSVKEVEDNLGIYFGEVPGDIDVKKYVRPYSSLAINVKWHHPKFNDKIISNPLLFEEISRTIVSVFWYKANQIAINYGYDACLPTGRSDGWAEPLIKSKSTGRLDPIVYWGKQNKTLQYLIQLKIFSMFAKDIENLFKLIDKEIQSVTNLAEFVILQNKIFDL